MLPLIAGALVIWLANAGRADAQKPAPTAPRAAVATGAAALARAGDAVVTIVAYREGSTDVTSGTGVLVSEGRVLTALRHLRGAARAEIFAADGDLLGQVSTLEQADVRLDLAVMARVTTTATGIVLARRSATLAQRVTVLGPKKGTVRAVAVRTVTHVEPDDNGRPLLRLGAQVATSAAGSPVVNARSELVAIAFGTVPGREEGDVAIDVSAIREVLARPVARLAFPSRDGTIAAARAPSADPKPVGSVANDPTARPRTATSIFPERYGAPISADTAGAFAVEMYGCARLESRQKVYCYLRVTNLGAQRTMTIAGGDLADSTGRKIREAENVVHGDTSQRVAGWRAKATVPLRELESVRLAVEFNPTARDADANRLLLDISGERTLSLGPLVLQRAP